MSSAGFSLHPGAARDISEIWDFVANNNPIAAVRTREELLEAIRGLASFPRQGHRRPDLTSRPLRFQIVREFLIAYAPEETPLLVIAVVHGRRSPRVIAAMLRSRE